MSAGHRWFTPQLVFQIRQPQRQWNFIACMEQSFFFVFVFFNADCVPFYLQVLCQNQYLLKHKFKITNNCTRLYDFICESLLFSSSLNTVHFPSWCCNLLLFSVLLASVPHRILAPVASGGTWAAQKPRGEQRSKKYPNLEISKNRSTKVLAAK